LAYIVFSLWAASGQAALESARILVLGASATSTSILKNLVLPGIGHFTIIDHLPVSPADAGNNFFLEGPSSVGKNRAEEAVRLLCELNDGVEGVADTRDIATMLADDGGRRWIKNFSLVIAHNLASGLLSDLSTLLWVDDDAPPLVVVRSAGFLAEFYIQFKEQQSMWLFSLF
jgi:NEDD8-activating enzyme E1 regulatory subunit